MKIINTGLHGWLDYIAGIIQITGPFIGGLHYETPEALVPLVLGIFLIIYSLFTDYEHSLVKKIPMHAHLKLDGIAALLLGFSPWVFGFAKELRWPYIVMAIVEVIIILLSKRKRESIIDIIKQKYYGIRK